MSTLVAAFNADTSSQFVDHYEVTFTVDGTPQPVISGPSLSEIFNGPFNPGDVDGASIVTVDKFGQRSPPVPSNPSTVTIPNPPPPTGVTGATLTFNP